MCLTLRRFISLVVVFALVALLAASAFAAELGATITPTPFLVDALAVYGLLGGFCSWLTTVLTTPDDSAPAWKRFFYRAIEFIAVVNAKTKENPTAMNQLLTVISQARNGDTNGALVAASEAYTALTGKTHNA